jgi:uncharacterized membrane protein YbaN (DUF454 family)
LVIGGIGVVVPILPTTPFVLGASACFVTSNPKLYQWLVGTRYFGEYIQNYKQKTGISNKARWMGIGFLWLTLGVSSIISQNSVVWVALGIIGVCVTIHILTISRPKSPRQPAQKHQNTKV